jgi:hypothetical protein
MKKQIFQKGEGQKKQDSLHFLPPADLCTLSSKSNFTSSSALYIAPELA